GHVADGTKPVPVGLAVAHIAEEERAGAVVAKLKIERRRDPVDAGLLDGLDLAGRERTDSRHRLVSLVNTGQRSLRLAGKSSAYSSTCRAGRAARPQESGILGRGACENSPPWRLKARKGWEFWTGLDSVGPEGTGEFAMRNGGEGVRKIVLFS